MKSKSLRLGVNIDHVATVRQARGGQQPDLLKAAHAAIKGGADILTVHLREDRRHIQDTDVYMLRESIDTPLNLELAATSEMVNIACSLEPWACCLVPERRAEVTTEGGLDVIGLAKQLKPVVEALQDKSIEVSVFLDPDNRQIKVAQELGISTIEFAYRKLFSADLTGFNKPIIESVDRVRELRESTRHACPCWTRVEL